MVNPFDLRGPEFLLFYFVFAFVVSVTVAVVRMRREEAATTSTSPRLLTNYLDIAFLRGGADGALQVAVVALVKRGLLIVEGSKVRARDESAIRAAQPGTERAVLERFATARSASGVSFDWALRRKVRDACEPTLVRLGLLPDAEMRSARHTLFFWAGLVLGSVAVGKIVVALSRGRTNIIFLILLALVFLAVAYFASHPRRTPAGDSALKDLERLFADLKGRVAIDSRAADDNELSLLAAVFGITVLYGAMPDARALFGPSSSGSSGSSCGSSGSSCGSGCGGGGGCGGCGS